MPTQWLQRNWIQSAVLFTAAGVFAGILASSACRAQETVTGHALVTATTKPADETSPIPRDSIHVFKHGKPLDVSAWVPLRGDRAALQLVVLLDDSSRDSIGERLSDLKSFLNALPPSTSVAIGYMRNGSPNLVQPLTTDHAKAASALRLPLSVPGVNGSPYFCLSDLVKHWPGEGNARREVIMITDGVDSQVGLRFDPENPYVTAAIQDAQRAGVVVYSIYYAGAGAADRNWAVLDAGHDYLDEVSASTGGQTYYIGYSDPETFQPFLSDIQQKLQNQYEVGFNTSPSKELMPITVKTTQPHTKIEAPEEVIARASQLP